VRQLLGVGHRDRQQVQRGGRGLAAHAEEAEPHLGRRRAGEAQVGARHRGVDIEDVERLRRRAQVVAGRRVASRRAEVTASTHRIALAVQLEPVAAEAGGRARHVLDVDARWARQPGPRLLAAAEVRLGLLGMRCEAATSALNLLSVAMPDAEQLAHSAQPGSIPWSQGQVNAFLYGTLLGGRIEELLTSIAKLHDVAPVPDAWAAWR